MIDKQEIHLEEEDGYERTPRELPKDIDLNQSVFRNDYSWKTWHGFWEKIKWFFGSWKPAWHRVTKGYCRMDTWNVDYSVTAYLIKVLIEYRNVTDGYPGNEKFPTFKSWIEALDQCIDLLIFSGTDTDKLNKYWPEYERFLHEGAKIDTDEEYKIFEKWHAEDVKIYEKQCEARKKAFAFLGEYLPHIWW